MRLKTLSMLGYILTDFQQRWNNLLPSIIQLRIFAHPTRQQAKQFSYQIWLIHTTQALMMNLSTGPWRLMSGLALSPDEAHGSCEKTLWIHSSVAIRCLTPMPKSLSIWSLSLGLGSYQPFGSELFSWH